ncbi:hypothetical protein MJ584_10015 [Klebsiella pneumoniae]|nr:hypothetical protein MJ584_10015 [Klebsiella pneumoniae]
MTCCVSRRSGVLERKIQFFVATSICASVFVRILFATDDPVEATKVMEIEPSRLTEELTTTVNRSWRSFPQRGQHYSQTIQREQNRIRMLNQGLVERLLARSTACV